MFAIVGPIGDPKAKDICQSFADQFSNGTIPDYRNQSDPQPPSDMACVMVHGDAGTGAGLQYWYAAMTRIESPATAINNASGWTGG